LFSQPTTAEYISKHFEAVWETVRPVPMVTIDFGGGNVLTRTFHGNVATYICRADGVVLDIVPGVYEPSAYRNRLDQARLLAQYVARTFDENQVRPQSDDDPQRVLARLRDYHTRQAGAMEKNQTAYTLVAHYDITKAGIERFSHVVLAGGPEGPVPGPVRRPIPHGGRDLDVPEAVDEALRSGLAEDTKLNETTRRPAVHTLLAANAGAKPAELTKRLYKDVLHADLDDPYLGLGKLLFGAYPFDDGAVR
jgi:hypothetical protein